jgi:hypothetical protein
MVRSEFHLGCGRGFDSGARHLNLQCDVRTTGELDSEIDRTGMFHRVSRPERILQRSVETAGGCPAECGASARQSSPQGKRAETDQVREAQSSGDEESQAQKKPPIMRWFAGRGRHSRHSLAFHEQVTRGSYTEPAGKSIPSFANLAKRQSILRSLLIASSAAGHALRLPTAETASSRTSAPWRPKDGRAGQTMCWVAVRWLELLLTLSTNRGPSARACQPPAISENQHSQSAHR